MRKFSTTLALGLFAFQAMACDVTTGSLQIDAYPNNVVKIYVAGTVANECFPTDSASLRIKFTCRNGQHTKEEIALTDTLIYEISGETSIGFSVIWWRGGKQVGRTDVEPKTVGTGNGLCFKRIVVVEPSGEPEISTENPPPPTHEIKIEDLVLIVNTIWPGQLREFDQNGILIDYHEFESSFVTNLDAIRPGLFYLNVLLFRPANEGGLISETLTVWLN